MKPFQPSTDKVRINEHLDSGETYPRVELPPLHTSITHINISDIAALAYCEQQVVWDKKLGRKRTPTITSRAVRGTQLHAQFEQDVRYLQQTGPLKESEKFGSQGDQLEKTLLNFWKILVKAIQLANKTIKAVYKRIFR